MGDDNIIICAGVRSTEHGGEMDPFDPAAHSPDERATHAGSVSYMFGKSYLVTCSAAEPDGDDLVAVTCTNMAGNELAVLSVRTSETVAALRALVSAALSSQLSDDAALQIELVSDGALLSDGSSIADAFLDK